ncbi:DUF6496 domain-containing protein [Chitinasiproducens palmae]|uniref:Ku family containing domain-containing protein n=1 Tax=Chitinasiproducens palmae TaxID=1770053 RepID=A0A1H2PRH1_9BURK|nr:DUF6496 domain-containing protein [Chitinasiproducens palmae]SDV49497.1 hypothetical protein SAMN05216551_108134 [Chitinasiproducens palmae]
MPQKQTIARAKEDKRQGKSASTQAGEFVKEQMHRIRAGEHGARSTKQAIAIGLSEARRAGVKASPGKNASAATRHKAEQDTQAAEHGTSGSKETHARRAAARKRVLKRESTRAASTSELSKHARSSAHKRTAADRSAAARKGAETKGAAGRSAAAKKAARTRAANAAARRH